LVVETVRSIAEFMIWGDQNEPRIFDAFLENNIMVYLHKMLLQPANRSGDVAKQVLQTLGIIIQNIKSETGTFFLFSNNHINNIVSIRFDFEDEEVLGYYISFLKAISLKLTSGTVQFFMMEDGNDGDGSVAFPLYSEAIKFAHHKEGMVRAGVRTLTLNVYSVQDPYIQAYVSAPPASLYFTDVAKYMAEQFRILDMRMAGAQGFGHQALSSLDSQIAEVEDMLTYCADVFATGHGHIAHMLAKQLWSLLVGPFLLGPLLGSVDADIARTGLLIKPQTALYVLERVFALITYKPLLHNVAVALLGCPQGNGSAGGVVQPWCLGFSGGAGVSCRLALAALLRSQDPGMAPAVLRLLVAVVKCTALSAEVMSALDVLPAPRRQDLLAACPSGACALCSLPGQLQQEREQAGSIPADSITAVVPSGQMAYVYYNAWASSLNALRHPLPGATATPGARSVNGLAPDISRTSLGASSSTQSDAVTPPASSTTSRQRQELPHPLADAGEPPGKGTAAQAAVGADVAPLISFEDDDSPPLPPPSSPPAAPHQHQGGAHKVATGTSPAQQGPGTSPAGTDPLGAGTLEPSLSTIVDDLVDGMIEAAVRELSGESEAGLQQEGAGPGPQAEAGSSTPPPASGPPLPDPDTPEAPPLPPCSAHAPTADAASGSWLTDALFDLLSTALLPVQSLWHAAYLLQQWLHRPPVSTDGTPKAAAGSGRESWACTVSYEQQQQLANALAAAASAALAEVDGMWGESFFSLLYIDWAVAADNIARPLLRVASELLIAGPHLYPTQAAPPAQQRTHALAMGISAVNALRMVHAVARLVALLQLSEVLREGRPSRSPPVPAAPAQDSQRADIIEGMQVEMTAMAIPCQVSFQAGTEKRVYLSAKGALLEHLELLQADPGLLLRAESLPPSAAPSPGAAGAGADGLRGEVLHSSPGIVLAEPAPTRLNYGIVMATAPLLGANPFADANVPRWLHMHVRPTVKGLLRVVRLAPTRKGGLLTMIKTLADGHWVLSFQDTERVENAVQMANEQARRVRALHKTVAGMVVESLVSLVL